MPTKTWPFGKENFKKFSTRKKREDETQMENRCNLTLKTNIAVLGFSVKAVLWDRNMPILQI